MNATVVSPRRSRSLVIMFGLSALCWGILIEIEHALYVLL